MNLTKKRKQKEGGALQINGMTKCSYAIVNKLMKIINLRSIRPELELEDKYANAEKKTDWGQDIVVIYKYIHMYREPKHRIKPSNQTFKIIPKVN